MSPPPRTLTNLSPIERVWDEIDGKVRSEVPKNRPELFTHLSTAWESLPPTNFYKLLEWMPRNCSAVINAHGGFFDEKKI